MNLHAEFIRLWKANRKASALVPPDKFFSGRVPNKIWDEKERAEININPPYLSITSEDEGPDGGTSATITKKTMVQIAAFAATRDEATRIRDTARDLYEDAELKLGGASETFQDISIDSSGETPPENEIFGAFQQFTVETSILRPQRKRV